MNKFSVRHTVVFSLKHPKGSAEEKEFLNACRTLAEIPGVQHFECLRQTSEMNKFGYGLSMEFETPEAYAAYQNFPAHHAFVQKYWINYVKDFLEIDYELLS